MKKNITYDTSLVVTVFFTSTELSCVVNDFSEVIPSGGVIAFFLLVLLTLLVVVVVASQFLSVVNISQIDVFFGGGVTLVETLERLTVVVERVTPVVLREVARIVVQEVILEVVGVV